MAAYFLVTQENLELFTIVQNWEQNTKQTWTFVSVGTLLEALYPQGTYRHSGFHLFKGGIKPTWKYGADKNGDKWIILLWKGLASHEPSI